MKTTKSDRWQVTRLRQASVFALLRRDKSARQAGDKMANAAHSHHVSRFTFHASAFTLIELLVVIAIMATLAALLLPVAGAVKKHQYIYNAQAEMAKLETAIDRYKAAYGFYPPDSHLAPLPNSLVNQLYYELVGTVYTNTTPPAYTTLDGNMTISAANVLSAFGVGGLMNCTKPNGDEGASAAKNFLPD
jgi:prepilin-type N-terminal cleavage/methylation domain-containing protein